MCTISYIGIAASVDSATVRLDLRRLARPLAPSEVRQLRGRPAEAVHGGEP